MDAVMPIQVGIPFTDEAYTRMRHTPPATIVPVPNKPKTPISNFRIPVELKQAAQAKAKEQGTDLTAVVVKALERYVKAK